MGGSYRPSGPSDLLAFRLLSVLLTFAQKAKRPHSTVVPWGRRLQVGYDYCTLNQPNRARFLERSRARFIPTKIDLT